MILADNIRRTLQRDAFVYIDSVTFRSLLVWQGAEQGDLDKMEDGSFHDAVAKDAEASMAFRQIAIHITNLVDLQLNLKKETDIDFITCPAFYTICNANGNGQHLALCLVLG